MNKKIRRASITVLIAAGFGALTALIIRDQITRRQRDLFSGSRLRRLAALGYLCCAIGGFGLEICSFCDFPISSSV